MDKTYWYGLWCADKDSIVCTMQRNIQGDLEFVITVRSYSLYLTEEGKVHHAVNYTDARYNIKTLYPYEAVRDGWRNVCGDYTIKQVIYRVKKGTLAFF